MYGAKLKELESQCREILSGGVNVCLVEDEQGLQTILPRMLSDAYPGLFRQVESFSTPQFALQRLIQDQRKPISERVNLLISDLKLPREAGGFFTDPAVGIEFLTQARTLEARPFTVAYTALPEEPGLAPLVDAIIEKGESNFARRIIDYLPSVIQHWAKARESIEWPINTLLVDDDPVVLRSELRDGDAFRKITRGQIDAERDARRALEILSTRNEDPSSENAVHLLVSDWNMGSTEEGEAFLGKVRELPRRPYIALYTGATKIGEEVRGLCDIVIQKSDAALYVEMQGVPHQARQFWKDNEAPEFEPRKPYEASKMSPLPKIDLKNFDPTKDNHHILDTQALPNNWTALLDFDNTLHISESSHGIMLQHFVEFLLNKNQSGYDQTQDGGDHERLEELYAYCQNWERQRDLLSRDMDIKERVIGYEEGLIHSGDLSAIAFKGMKLSKLSGFAGRFVNHFMKGRFPATNERSIKKIREHGIVGVLTTGTPDFLVPHLLPKLDLNFGYGMTYTMRELTDSNGQKDFELTGKVDVNQGLATAKAELGTRLKKSGRPVAFAMGDSIGDSGSASSAIHRSTIKWDVNGSAVIVNATDEAKAEFMRHYQNDRIRVTVPREQTDDRVIADIGVAMRTIFWPLHEYLSLQDNKEALLRFEERFREQGENEDTIRNLENLKRLRDILEREGLAKDQIRAHLERFYPAPLVDSILKSGIINTRNEPDFRGWLLKSVAEAGEDTSDIREAIEVILRGNRMIHQKNGSIQPVTRRPSKVPPPDSTSED